LGAEGLKAQESARSVVFREVYFYGTDFYYSINRNHFTILEGDVVVCGHAGVFTLIAVYLIIMKHEGAEE
jgi:hypothetical protein